MADDGEGMDSVEISISVPTGAEDLMQQIVFLKDPVDEESQKTSEAETADKPTRLSKSGRGVVQRLGFALTRKTSRQSFSSNSLVSDVGSSPKRGDNPFDSGGPELVSIHARELRTGAIQVIEMPIERTLGDAIKDIAERMGVPVARLVLMAETKEDIATSSYRTPLQTQRSREVLGRQQSRRKSFGEQLSRRLFPQTGDGARDDDGTDEADCDHADASSPTTTRRFFSLARLSPRFAGVTRQHALLSSGSSVASFGTSTPRGGRGSPTSPAASVQWDATQRTAHRPRNERRRTTMTETMMRTLTFDSTSPERETCKRRRPSDHGTRVDYAEDSLYYYREAHERSAFVDKPLPWYEFLRHTELCRMSYDACGSSDAANMDVAVRMLENLKIPSILKKSIDALSLFLYDVCELMHDADYHNFNHVVDVTQCLYVTVVTTQIINCVTPISLAAAFLAALCHDLDHPGFSNVYVNNEDFEIARRYDKQSPLEKHSVACFRALAAKHTLFEHLSEQDAARIDAMVETLILRTDMAHHAALMRTVAEDLDAIQDGYLDTDPGVDLVMSLALKCADISNQARPWKIATKWNLAVYQEFWKEGDADLAKGRPVNPIHVRASKQSDIAQKTLGFIKFVVVPLYEQFRDLVVKCATFHAVLDPRVITEAITVLTTNLEHYQLEADGLRVPQDGLADRPGICGPQQLKLEQRRFERARKHSSKADLALLRLNDKPPANECVSAA